MHATYPISFGGRLKGKHIRRSGQHLIREQDVDLEQVIGYLLLLTKTMALSDETSYWLLRLWLVMSN